MTFFRRLSDFSLPLSLQRLALQGFNVMCFGPASLSETRDRTTASGRLLPGGLMLLLEDVTAKFLCDFQAELL